MSQGSHPESGRHSRQARPAEPSTFGRIERLLDAAEREIALLRRVQPRNYAVACAALERALRRSEPPRLQLEHAPAPDFSELRRSLEAAARQLDTEGELGALYAERARELEQDAALVNAIGTPEFKRLALARHGRARGNESAAADRLAQAWAAQAPERDPGVRVSSDDPLHPDSLVNLLRREIGAARLPFRVRVLADLPSVAAVTRDAVLVRAGVPLSARQAHRVTHHELFGHALPRAQARSQPCGIFRVGSAGAEADEEGRALLLEKRSGLMDAERRHELGLRHVAALVTAGGAELFAVAHRLVELDCAADMAAAIALRVARGGGLCRELSYLPGWLRVAAAFASEPELEAWLERGRISIAAARRLQAFSACQSIPIELPSRPA